MVQFIAKCSYCPPSMAKFWTDREARPRWNEPDSSTNFVAFMRRGVVEYDHRGAD